MENEPKQFTKEQLEEVIKQMNEFKQTYPGADVVWRPNESIDGRVLITGPASKPMPKGISEHFKSKQQDNYGQEN